MFRITFLVDDKRLPLALYALTSIALGKPEVDPVVNAVRKGKEVHAKTNGKYSDILVDYFNENRITEFTGSEVKNKYVQMIGGNPNSYSHYINDAVKDKRVKKIGRVKGSNDMRYGVV
jgi:hypothetical protein